MTELSKRSLRVCSFAGGGCRVLSCLIVLDRVMKEIAHQEGQKGETLRPCDYFDLMGGTSAGGILAIMLGRLEMTVPECIAAFKKMSKRIFGKGRKRMRVIRCWKSAYTYKSSYLTEAVKAVLRDQGRSDDDLLHDPSVKDGCLTFVTAIPKRCMTENSKPSLFRSYPAPCPGLELQNTTIWQAIQATTAAPFAFKPAQISGDIQDSYSRATPAYEFIDAAAGGFNDPSFEVQSEARDIWPGREIGVFLNLATGERDTIGIKDHNLFAYIKTLASAGKHVVTGNERNAARVEADFGRDTFFRFNPDNRIGNIRITDWRKMEEIDLLTNQYLEGPDAIDKIQRLVRKILNNTRPGLPVPELNPGAGSPWFLKTAKGGEDILTIFPYAFASEKPIFSRIAGGVKLYSEAEKSYNEALSYRARDGAGGDKNNEKSPRVRCIRYLEKAAEQIAEAIRFMVTDYIQTGHPGAQREVARLKFSYTAVLQGFEPGFSLKYSTTSGIEPKITSPIQSMCEEFTAFADAFSALFPKGVEEVDGNPAQ